MKLNYTLILVSSIILQCSCKKKDNTGIIVLNDLRKDTTLSIKTNQTSPTTLKLFIEKPLGSAFMINNVAVNPKIKRDTVVQDRYNSDFSIQIKMPQFDDEVETDSSVKNKLTIKIEYLLL